MVVHDLQVSNWLFPERHAAHDVGEGQEEVVRLALAQHFGQVALRATSSSKTFFPSSAKPAPSIDSGAFADAALLIRYTYHLGFRYIGVPSFSIDLAACGETDGYVRV